jgi:hypothetical protein
MIVGLWYLLAVCVCVFPHKFWMLESIFTKLGACIIAPEPLSTAYFINSHQSVCLYVCLPIIARQRIEINAFPWQRIRVTKESLQVSLCIQHFSICIVEAVIRRLAEPSDSKIWSWVSSLCWRGPAEIYLIGLCICLFFLGNGLVNTFPRQRKIVEYVFCAVHVV